MRINHPSFHAMVATAVTILALATVPRSVSAQSSHSENVVVVALVGDAQFSDGNVRIIQQKDGNQRNVILLLRSAATSGVLEHAMQYLVESRNRHGKVPKYVHTLVMHDLSGASKDPATIQLFARLLNATPFNVAGVGSVPAVAVRLSGPGGDDAGNGR
jgi:hypothetical protein